MIKKVLFGEDKAPKMPTADELGHTEGDIGSTETTKIHNGGMFNWELYYGIEDNTTHEVHYARTPEH